MNSAGVDHKVNHDYPRARTPVFSALVWILLSLTTASAQTYTFTTFAGSASQAGATDGTGSAARFSSPSGIDLDSAGNLYIADRGNHTIRKITPAGIVTTLAGAPGQSGSADGLGSAARFNGPTDVAVDSAGNVYVADRGNAVIRKITPAGIVSTMVTGAAAPLFAPFGVAVDGAGNVFVTDRALQIIGKTTAAGVASVLAGSPTQSGSADGTGGAARFFTPSGVVADSTGGLYVIDNDNYTVRKVTASGTVTTLAGVARQGGYADGTGSAARFSFSDSTGVAVDSAGNVLVADDRNQVIRKITPAGVVSTVAGLAGSSGSLDGVGSSARFQNPLGLVIDSAGNIFVADTGNHTIRRGVIPGAVVTPIPPTIITQPISVTANTGTTVAFVVSASGAPPLAYQWRKNGVAITGATTETLMLASVLIADAGNYTVVVTNSAGTATSNPATLTITSGQPSRLPNLSVRTNLGAAQTLFVGFATNGAKTMLVRGIGPTLAVFGLSGVLSDPVIELYNSASVKIEENNDWNAGLASVFVDVGAFALTGGSRDAALQRVCTGAYTAQIKSAGSGVVLVEVYDTGGTGKLVNVSARNAVGTGDNILIAGFVVDGTAAKTLLIRGVGAKLVEFGVGGVLADPKLEIYNAAGLKIAENDSWNALLQPVARSVGAFDLTLGSRDAALLITLAPGTYTAQISGVGATTGEAIVEVYEVP